MQYQENIILFFLQVNASRKNNINNEMLCALADIYNVSTDYLLGREEHLPSYLTMEERKLIEEYRKLDERGQKGILHAISFEIEYSLRNKKKTGLLRL